MNRRIQSKNIKQDNKLPTTRNTTQHICCILKYLLYFQVFAIFSSFVHMYFDSCTTPNWKFLFLEDVNYQSSNLNFRIRTPILHGFSVICILDTPVTRMWPAGHQIVQPRGVKRRPGCASRFRVVRCDLGTLGYMHSSISYPFWT